MFFGSDCTQIREFSWSAWSGVEGGSSLHGPIPAMHRTQRAPYKGEVEHFHSLRLIK